MKRLVWTQKQSPATVVLIQDISFLSKSALLQQLSELQVRELRFSEVYLCNNRIQDLGNPLVGAWRIDGRLHCSGTVLLFTEDTQKQFQVSRRRILRANDSNSFIGNAHHRADSMGRGLMRHALDTGILTRYLFQFDTK